MIPLVAVAHGSRDPRSARAVAAVLAALKAEDPDRDVRLAFLDLSTPSVPQVLDALAGQGHRQVVVVPLLLGSAFHARVDLPALLREARVRHPQLSVLCSDILGDDDLLVDAVRDNIVATGVDPGDESVGIALCAVGSRRPESNAATASVLPRVLEKTAWRHSSVCFVTAAQPTVPDALTRLSRSGARRIVLAPWILAPGLLWDRACDAAGPDVRIASTLTCHDAVGQMVARRYVETLRSDAVVHAA